MILNNQYFSSVTPPQSANERLVNGATQSNTIHRGSVVDGVKSGSNAQQRNTLHIGDEEQQEQRQSSTLTQAQYEKFAQAHQENKTIYDQPQGAQRLAISEYQSVKYAPQREEIQSLVGINTFA